MKKMKFRAGYRRTKMRNQTEYSNYRCFERTHACVSVHPLNREQRCQDQDQDQEICLYRNFNMYGRTIGNI
jgi:hypothetical protein